MEITDKERVMKKNLVEEISGQRFHEVKCISYESYRFISKNFKNVDDNDVQGRDWHMVYCIDFGKKDTFAICLESEQWRQCTDDELKKI